MSVFHSIKSSQGRLSYRWIVVLACFFIAAMSYGGMYSFGVFFKPMREDCGWTSAATSGIFSVYALTYCSLSILSGLAVDRFGGRVTIGLGGLFIGLGLLVTSQATSLWHIYISYGLLAGAGMSTIYGPLQVIVSRWFKKQKGLALGIVSSGIGAGTLTIPPLASYLISLYGWRSCYIIMGVAIGVCVTMTAVLFLGKNPSSNSANLEEQTLASTFERDKSANDCARDDDRNLGSSKFSIQKLLRVQAFWLLAVISLMVSFGMQMIMVHTIPYLEEAFKFSSIAAAAVLSNMGLASIFGRLIMGAVSDHIGRKKALAISTLIEGIMMMVLVNSSNIGAVYLFAILFGFGYGGHAPQTPALIGELFGLQRLGTFLGILLIFYGIGAALGPFLAGYIRDITGSYKIAFSLGGLAMFVATSLALLIRESKVTEIR